MKKLLLSLICVFGGVGVAHAQCPNGQCRNPVSIPPSKYSVGLLNVLPNSHTNPPNVITRPVPRNVERPVLKSKVVVRERLYVRPARRSFWQLRQNSCGRFGCR